MRISQEIKNNVDNTFLLGIYQNFATMSDKSAMMRNDKVAYVQHMNDLIFHLYIVEKFLRGDEVGDEKLQEAIQNLNLQDYFNFSTI